MVPKRPIRSDTRDVRENERFSMSIEKNVQVVKNFLAALGRRDKQGLLALSAEDIEWIMSSPASPISLPRRLPMLTAAPSAPCRCENRWRRSIRKRVAPLLRNQ